MTVEAELIAAIAATPDDDAPRMVYADHLMQRGDPRGEYIALQCRLDRADAIDEPVDDALIVRERALREHLDAWTAPQRAVFDAGYVFRRGFVEHVAVWSVQDVTYPTIATGATLEEIEKAAVDRTDRLAELLERTPLLRSINVRAEAIMRPLPPSWAQLQTVHLHGPGYSNPESITVALGRMPALRRLHLTSASLVDQQVASFLELAQPLEHLGIHTGWHVSSRPTPDIVAERIAANPRLHGLRSLHLAGFEIAGVERLACLTSLERLSLDRCRVDPPSLLELVSKLPALTMLEYQFDDSRTTGLEIAKLLQAAPSLRRLALSGITIGDIGDRDVEVRALAGSGLRRLILDRALIYDRGARALLAAPDLAPIELQITGTGEELTLQVRELVEARALRYRRKPAGYPRRVVEMMPTNMIMAIKEYRELTGCGLSEAKMTVEQIREEHTDRPAYNHVRAMSRWCGP